jgi:hypothetical protein
MLMRVFNRAQFHIQIFNALACDHATRIAYVIPNRQARSVLGLSVFNKRVLSPRPFMCQ